MIHFEAPQAGPLPVTNRQLATITHLAGLSDARVQVPVVGGDALLHVGKHHHEKLRYTINAHGHVILTENDVAAATAAKGASHAR